MNKDDDEDERREESKEARDTLVFALLEYIPKPFYKMHGWTVGSLDAVQACYCPGF